MTTAAPALPFRHPRAVPSPRVTLTLTLHVLMCLSFLSSLFQSADADDQQQQQQQHQQPPPNMSQHGRVNAVYYPNWHLYRNDPPSSLDLPSISHILYAFIKVNEDGSLKLIDEHADTVHAVDGVQGGLAALAQLKRTAPHIRTLISVGGGTASAEFPALAANPAARERFAREIREFVDRHDFNGVDIDWEHPSNPEQGLDYVRLLEDVRQTLPAPHYLITSALPPGKWILRNIDLRRAGAVLDYINLMCYDLTGPWTDVSGNHAQLRASAVRPNNNPTLMAACADGIAYVTECGFPSWKILLGIPVYARTFPAARGVGQSTEGSAEIDYKALPHEYVDGAQVDDSAAAASFVDSTNGFSTFDVPRTVWLKADYVKRMGLGGLFYWTGSADRPGPHSLVQAGFNALHS